MIFAAYPVSQEIIKVAAVSAKSASHCRKWVISGQIGNSTDQTKLKNTIHFTPGTESLPVAGDHKH